MKVRDEKEEEREKVGQQWYGIPMNKIRKKPRVNCKRKTRKQSTVYVPYNKAYKKPCTYLVETRKKEVKKMLSKRKKENEIFRVS